MPSCFPTDLSAACTASARSVAGQSRASTPNRACRALAASSRRRLARETCRLASSTSSRRRLNRSASSASRWNAARAGSNCSADCRSRDDLPVNRAEAFSLIQLSRVSGIATAPAGSAWLAPMNSTVSTPPAVAQTRPLLAASTQPTPASTSSPRPSRFWGCGHSSTSRTTAAETPETQASTWSATSSPAPRSTSALGRTRRSAVPRSGLTTAASVSSSAASFPSTSPTPNTRRLGPARSTCLKLDTKLPSRISTRKTSTPPRSTNHAKSSPARRRSASPPPDGSPSDAASAASRSGADCASGEPFAGVMVVNRRARGGGTAHRCRQTTRRGCRAAPPRRDRARRSDRSCGSC